MRGLTVERYDRILREGQVFENRTPIDMALARSLAARAGKDLDETEGEHPMYSTNGRGEVYEWGIIITKGEDKEAQHA